MTSGMDKTPAIMQMVYLVMVWIIAMMVNMDSLSDNYPYNWWYG